MKQTIDRIRKFTWTETGFIRAGKSIVIGIIGLF